MSPGQLDVPLLRRHLLALREAAQVLEIYRGRPVDVLRSDLRERWAVERGLQICAQNALDIATHIAATAGRDVRDYGSAIDRLVELAVLDRAFAERFRGVAGFRNVLVHGYLGVDLEVLHRLVNERLADFAEFGRAVERHLEETERRPPP